MLMGVLMSISRGGSRKTEFFTWGTMGGVITWWSHFCRPLGGGGNPVFLMSLLHGWLHKAHVYVHTAVGSHAHGDGASHAREHVHQQHDKPFQNGH